MISYEDEPPSFGTNIFFYLKYLFRIHADILDSAFCNSSSLLLSVMRKYNIVHNNNNDTVIDGHQTRNHCYGW